MKIVITFLLILSFHYTKANSDTTICGDSSCIIYISQIVGDDAYINWVIQTHNNSLMILEKSYDGKTFHKIYSIEMYPTLVPCLFGYKDANICKEKLWYKITIIETFNGKTYTYQYQSELVTHVYKITQYSEE